MRETAVGWRPTGFEQGGKLKTLVRETPRQVIDGLVPRRRGHSLVSQLSSLSLVTFQPSHLVFSFANRVVPRDK